MSQRESVQVYELSSDAGRVAQLGSMMNHATAQMNHKPAHQAAFHRHSIGLPGLPYPYRTLYSNVVSQVHANLRCGGFQRGWLWHTLAGSRSRTTTDAPGPPPLPAPDALSESFRFSFVRWPCTAAAT